MFVKSVPCLVDNFAFLFGQSGSAQVLLVDPGEAAPVQAELETYQLELCGILLTHHHADHWGGLAELRRSWPTVPVYGHASNRPLVPEQTESLLGGEQFEAANLTIRVLHVPGHTVGSVAYCVENALFTGDTLFGAGCGRLLGGTAEALYHSLNVEMAPLPGNTEVYFGHDYTVKNLAFAALVEPSNSAIADRLARLQSRCLTAIGAGGGDLTSPRVPSTLAEERATNPFLRVTEPTLAEYFHRTRGELPRSPGEAFAWLRRDKDRF